MIGMLLRINDNIEIWQKYSPLERTGINAYRNKTQIGICGRWFDVITPSELVRMRNPNDGYYRVVYIQINMDTGEYYIGKSNRPTWSTLKRYQGSGLKFTHKYRKNSDKFVRFFIAALDTQEETEELEAKIVNNTILSDRKCLNLVAGGAGTSNRPPAEERNQKIRRHMLNTPQQSKAMLEGAKKMFQSGDTAALRSRSQRIKEVMSQEKYRKMTSNRIKNWIENDPEGYAESRRKNKESLNTPEVQAKRKVSLEKWKEENPEQYKEWQNKLAASRNNPESKQKRKDSLRKWREDHPEQAKANTQKRAKAAAAKLSKPISMYDLQTGKILKEFSSQKAAALWLVAEGRAKNKNCVTAISSVCLRKEIKGHGVRKSAYGYGWRFRDEEAHTHKEQQLSLWD